MPMLICITGKAKAGKDTVGDFLYEKHGFTKLPLAGPLKLAASVAFRNVPSNYHDQDLKAAVDPLWGITRRQELQNFGESLCQTFGEDFWIRRWMLDYTLLAQTDHVVVTDVRKDVEADFFRSIGGRIVHLYRTGSGLSGPEGMHRTEQGVLSRQGDFTIVNDGTLGDLERQVERLIGAGA